MFEHAEIRTELLLFLGMAIILLALFRFTRHHKNIRDRIKNPVILILLLFSIFNLLYMGGRSLPARAEPYFFAVLYLSIAILIIRVAILLFFDLFLVRTRSYRAPRLLKEISSVVLFTLALVFILQTTLRIQITTLLATSALITVVLGLALQETLGNLFAGLALHLDPPYLPGDWIRTADNILGRVEEITWRATKLRTVNNDYIIIPNGQIAKEKLTNHSFPRTPHASRVEFTAGFNVPPNRVAKIVTDLLSETDNVTMEPAPEIRVNAYQDFAINYQIKFWMKDYGLIEPTLAAIRKGIWYHFHRHEIELPFPVRQVYLHEREEMLVSKDQSLSHLARSLNKVYLFAALDEEECRLIAERLVELHFAEREMIIREGEVGDSLFIIDSGEVEVFITGASGRKKVLSTLSEGNFFGEIALLTGERRSASVQARTDVRLHELKKDGFKEVLESKPDILDQISSVLSRRRDQLFDIMSESSGPLEEQTLLDGQDAKSRIIARIRNYFGL